MEKRKKLKQLVTYLKTEVLINKQKRKTLELFIISSVFFLAGTVFSVINYITGENILGYVTTSFAVISLITLLITVIKPNLVIVGEILFVVASLVMFIYFMIAGGAGDIGFSTYWIILLPFVSTMILGLKKGTIITGLMFVTICLLLWVPALRDNVLRWKPDQTFILRFPLVYLAAACASALFEYSRYLTDKANDNLKEKLEDAAYHDPLTGLTSRYGLNQLVSTFDYMHHQDNEGNIVASCFVIDVDNFKSANDNYGHIFGDKVLVEISKILKSYAGDNAIRFGGDEFVLLFFNKTEEELFRYGEEIRSKVENLAYEDHPEAKYTVSVGIASHEVTMAFRIDKVIELADTQSSKAKKQGKNKVFILDTEKELQHK